MLEYDLDDAQSLLAKNEEAASKSLNQVDEELSYITDQTTTLEVSILLMKQLILLWLQLMIRSLPKKPVQFSHRNTITVQFFNNTHRWSYMSAHVLLNLLN